MSLNLHSSSRQGRRAFRPVSEINVTPLVDVMLVLLIIFMITAPMMTVGVNVDLPQTCAGPVAASTEPLTVSIKANGKIYIQQTETPPENLMARLQAITHNKLDTKIFVRADKALPYGKVMESMGMIAGAGFTKVALIAEQSTKN